MTSPPPPPPPPPPSEPWVPPGWPPHGPRVAAGQATGGTGTPAPIEPRPLAVGSPGFRVDAPAATSDIGGGAASGKCGSPHCEHHPLPASGGPAGASHPDPHAQCDPRSRTGTTVQCDRCQRTLVVSPLDDFYCAAEGDHCCERCLIGGLPLQVIDSPDCEDSPLPAGLAPDHEVWIAIPRRRVEYHQPTPAGLTTCLRSMRTGEVLPVLAAVEAHEATPCPRCWPPTQDGDRCQA